MFDHIALRVAKRLYQKQNDFNRYKLIEKMFILLPFMHSENVQDVETSVKITKLCIEYSDER